MNISNKEINFYEALNEYTKDGILESTEKNNLKNLYISQTGISSQEYDDSIAPTLENLFSASNKEETKTISEIIKNVIADGSLTYDEYKGIKDHYIKKYGIDSYKFNEIFSLLIGDSRAVLDWVYSEERNQTEALEISKFIKERFSSDISDIIARELERLIVNSLIKGRCYDDYSKYVFEMLKNEISKTNYQIDFTVIG